MCDCVKLRAIRSDGTKGSYTCRASFRSVPWVCMRPAPHKFQGCFLTAPHIVLESIAFSLFFRVTLHLRCWLAALSLRRKRTVTSGPSWRPASDTHWRLWLPFSCVSQHTVPALHATIRYREAPLIRHCWRKKGWCTASGDTNYTNNTTCSSPCMTARRIVP